MKLKTKLLIGGVALALLAGAGGGWWWWTSHTTPTDAAARARKAVDYKYVSLDKVLVMLRGEQGQAVPHYMAIDIVFKAEPRDEARAKEHLPLLRTVAVKALSVNTLQTATAMSIDQVAQALNRAYVQSYEADGRKPPFAEALVGRMIIE
ncbi:flagellar basal body protein [Roseateles sp. BYS78W]|uniref:Flagellar basal body protein n=1 Tax=Pelomonas candidula TaxID=3299025 RepID=A0ABW7HGZ2_9BURK